MSDNPALLKAVLAAPDDDLPRLVYADWFEENGDPDRGEFIRLQCQLAHTPDAPESANWLARERELLDAHSWEWAELLHGHVSQWQFRRGFVDAVEMSLERPAKEFLPVFDLAPIRRLRDTGQFCDLTGLIEALPRFEQLTGLEFWGLYAFDDALVGELLASPHLASLRTLILHHDRNGNTVSDEVIAAGLRATHRRNLEHLAVQVDGMWRGPTRDVLAAVADSPHLRKLKSLNLSNAGDGGNRPEMDLATARALGESPNLAGLEELDLVQTSFDLETWDEVLRWPFLRRLKRLSMNSTRQVNPPSYLTVAEIAKLPAYRAAFDAAVPTADWNTEFFTPFDGTASWVGQSWGGLRQRHLFGMWRFVKEGQYDELEAAYRKDCVKYAGEAVAEAIDAVPFDAYHVGLLRGLRQTVAAAGSYPTAKALWLRVRTDLRWQGNFHLSAEAEAEPFTPHDEDSYTGPLTEIDAGSLPEAGAVRNGLNPPAPLDPGGGLHYLSARTVAAFGRAVQATRAPLPVYFSCVSAAFKMG